MHLSKIQKSSRNGKRLYKGTLTKRAVRFNKLTSKQWEMDELRWTLGAPKSLRSKLF